VIIEENAGQKGKKEEEPGEEKEIKKELEMPESKETKLNWPGLWWF